MSKVVNNEIQAKSLADNEIQSKKPEVGDVWELADGSIFRYRYYILEVRPWSDYIDVLSDKMVRTQKSRNFFKACTYLGKSKVKIEDSFKTENEQ